MTNASATESDTKFESHSQRERLAALLEQAWEEDASISYGVFFSRMKRDNREQLVELIEGSSLIELMVKALELLQSKKYSNNRFLNEAQAATQNFVDEQIGERVLLSNPDYDDQNVAAHRRAELERTQDLAANQGIPGMLIRLPQLREIAQEAQELRNEAAEIMASQEYQEYTARRGSLPLDGSKDYLSRIGQRMLEIARLAENFYGFETCFENNGPINASPFPSL